MNDFIIYINGMLAAPNLFEIRLANTVNGKYLQITGHEDKVRDACQGAKKLVSVDVMEVRASKVVKRYRYEKSEENDDNFIRLKENPDEKLPARVRFRCQGVPSSF